MVPLQVPHNVRFTDHAIQRMRQRGISRRAVAYALLYGKWSHHPEEAEITLSRERIQPEDRRQMEGAAGLKVVFNRRTGEVITAYYPERLPRPARRRGRPFLPAMGTRDQRCQWTRHQATPARAA